MEMEQLFDVGRSILLREFTLGDEFSLGFSESTKQQTTRRSRKHGKFQDAWIPTLTRKRINFLRGYVSYELFLMTEDFFKMQGKTIEILTV